MGDNARDIAINALGDRDGNVSARVRRLLGISDLSDAEKSLASELALGVVRRKGTLDAVLQHFLARPDRRLPRPMREILHVGLYQILFLDRIPDHAAVNEAVRQAIRFRHKRQGGLVNGVLRTVLRNISDPIAGPCPITADAIPTGPDSHRTTSEPIFPDPASNPIGYLAAAFSLPEELAGRWIKNRGSLRGAIKLAVHANTRAARIVRVNTTKATVVRAAEILAEQGVETIPHANGLSLVVTSRQSLQGTAAFTDGLIQPQDATATGVCAAVGVKEGMNVLDFCAAPGTKTTHLAELMGDSGKIIACDVNEAKLRRIEENCQRLGITSVTTMLAQRAGSLEPESFDRVLVDVPCSNTGVLARRPEARWRFSASELSRYVKDQKGILSAASIFVRPGGRLIYSTCSIEPAECESVAKWLVAGDRRLTLRRNELTLPGGATDRSRWHDGGYMAIFQA